MGKKLFNLYNQFKDQFSSIIVKAVGDKIEFSPYIRFSFSRDSDDIFVDIVGIEFDPDEDTHYVHNYITFSDLDVQEYWTPLRDLTFDELFMIAERL